MKAKSQAQELFNAGQVSDLEIFRCQDVPPAFLVIKTQLLVRLVRFVRILSSLDLRNHHSPLLALNVVPCRSSFQVKLAK